MKHPVLDDADLEQRMRWSASFHVSSDQIAQTVDIHMMLIADADYDEFAGELPKIPSFHMSTEGLSTEEVDAIAQTARNQMLRRALRAMNRPKTPPVYVCGEEHLSRV